MHATTIRLGYTPTHHFAAAAAFMQGFTLVHISAQPKPCWSHLCLSLCLIDWGKIMHPSHPAKYANVEPNSGRVQAPAFMAASQRSHSPWMVITAPFSYGLTRRSLFGST